MAELTLLLDTNILWDIALCQRLAEKRRDGQLEAYIPTIIHAERIRQITDQHGEEFSIDVVRQFIGDYQFELLPFSRQDAETVAQVWLYICQAIPSDERKTYWLHNCIDILLCAVAHARGYTLVTNDQSGHHFEVVSNRMTTNELETHLLALV
ncbi:MAG: PIN domain-containing protein [Chloroflexota bacterium]|jgi:predicted nucleic acid-binding protein